MIQTIIQLYIIVKSSGYGLLYAVAKSLCTWNNGKSLEIVSTVYDFMMPLGLSLALCLAVVEIMDAITRSGTNNVTVEVVIMPLIKFGIAYLVISNGIEIISTVLGGSNAFCDWVDAEIGSVTPIELSPESGIFNGLLTKILFEYIPSFVSLLSQIIAALVIGVQLVSIRLEVLVRAMFFPLAVADVSSKGASGSGMRYIKNLFGCIFLLGSILIVIKLVYMISADLMIDFGSTVWSSFSQLTVEGLTEGGLKLVNMLYMVVFNGLIGPFACISAISTVKSMIREVFS